MKQIKVNPNNEQFYSKEFIRGFNLGAERQYEADVADMPKWIPCSERLPSESGYYLATLKNSFETEVAIIWFAHIDDYGSKSEWREITDDDTVLAWMPLPDPWEGGDDD